MRDVSSCERPLFIRKKWKSFWSRIISNLSDLICPSTESKSFSVVSRYTKWNVNISILSETVFSRAYSNTLNFLRLNHFINSGKYYYFRSTLALKVFRLNVSWSVISIFSAIWTSSEIYFVVYFFSTWTVLFFYAYLNEEGASSSVWLITFCCSRT